MFQSSLPKMLQTEAILTTTYILNRYIHQLDVNSTFYMGIWMRKSTWMLQKVIECPQDMYANSASFIALLVNVDDVGPSESQTTKVKCYFHNLFTIKDLGPVVISWKTKKQNSISQSTVEAQYKAMGSIACELTSVYSLLQDLQVSVSTQIPFFCDKRATLHIISNPVFHERTKHLKIDCHLIWDKYKAGLLAPSMFLLRISWQMF
ncbi:UNVERIFIED_CONTAM: hypothetical protein Slati_0924700 [Sesamum latifolium]|uniref:Copia protein n=1 Tax=Sesamum latifolium TaxID=2727402 RepID=A0AAW2XQN4_9LAMI